MRQEFEKRPDQQPLRKTNGGSRPRAKTTPAIRWLKERIWADVYGVQRVVAGKVEARPSYTRWQYLERRCRHPTPRFLNILPNYKYARHVAGSTTHYYFGNPA